jgi:hypothetical protein
MSSILVLGSTIAITIRLELEADDEDSFDHCRRDLAPNVWCEGSTFRLDNLLGLAQAIH